MLDLITYFPRGYEDRSNIKYIADCKDGEKVGIYARLAVPVTEVRVKGGLKLYKMIFVDEMKYFGFNLRILLLPNRKDRTHAQESA